MRDFFELLCGLAGAVSLIGLFFNLWFNPHPSIQFLLILIGCAILALLGLWSQSRGRNEKK